jgi:hypothetical protein
VSYTVGCTPAPLTFTIRPKFDWHNLLTIAWMVLIVYMGWQNRHSLDYFSIVIFGFIVVTSLLAFVRRERIEIYSERMAWRKTYFAITRSKEAPLDEVLGAEWREGNEGGRGKNRAPDYLEFFLSTGSVKAGFGLTFDEFDRMRYEIGTMFPSLIKRWGTSSIRSKDFTLLNLN